MSPTFRKIGLLLIDAILINLAVFCVLLVRFEGVVPPQHWHDFQVSMPIITGITLLCLWFFRIYSRLWEYASIDEVFSIVKAISVSLLVVMTVTLMTELHTLPRSVYVGSWIFLIGFIGGSRLAWRLVRSSICDYDNARSGAVKRVLIVGAGAGGMLLAREIHSNPGLKRKLIGFVDDDPQKQKMIMAGIPVLGSTKRIPALVNDLKIDEIIIGILSVEGSVIRSIVETCRKTPAQVRILPGIFQNTTKNLYHNLRDVQMEDLLRRKPVSVDFTELGQCIMGKTVLITGAAGSIGSELCRQIIDLKPAHMILVDNSENGLFDIENELLEKGLCPKLYPQLADIRNRDKLDYLFATYRPHVVFHAAAYKHVPMMERNPEEAIANNVNGTRIIAELADKYYAETFILISTDKAVNPTSIMGASKRIAELVVKDINRNSKTRFAVVRFGNVLGSRGSVVPTFIKQIEKGGPVTVTHPDMTRYFMTIPEAVQLVIQASAMAKGGEIFVLDMGEPVKIDDLARELIRLSGFEPGKDIEIVYSGIRPGEKLYEELFTDREGLSSTSHARIFISTKKLDENYMDISKTIQNTMRRAFNGPPDVAKLITELIPEYRSTNPVHQLSKTRSDQAG